ncbi:MAG: holin family protein [Oscillospiraceae bacterium]
MDLNRAIRASAAFLGAVGGFLFGEVTGLFWAVIALMCIDYITGVILAVAERKLSSAAGFRGIAKKLCIIMLMAVAHVIDAQVIGTGAALMTAVQVFFIANEGISILENSAALGLPVPQKLRDVLEQLRDKDKEDK